ncbi:hypothetical protein PR048_026910 [Dryococelus australis]|uniref:HTH psq-type domain-containing protein n=1 Tax=Dryococelus australis TaxID=614101 RepID=A0ABQ9GML5_9NEOP|nr:hypothetical protein PR048_026910 [Dryococelus australis]
MKDENKRVDRSKMTGRYEMVDARAIAGSWFLPQNILCYTTRIFLKMRERKTQRQSYDLQSMQAAVDAVRFMHLTPSAASNQYNIPRTTLRCQLQFETVKKGMGRKQDIPAEIEFSLVDHIF